VTPAILLASARKTIIVIPFVRNSENISEGMKNAKEYAEIPEQFDAVSQH
jgi:hypothetical protein